ncbi:PepSY domain-containing protein [uncultured Roseovarius sp.]|uniref:PepSY-associated TM helix domain-containing protein n=1 Tax=uncultured Roseovarius sp. TaxID=293344 RepID=UPI0026189937|nr:PepSY-associated TM helix domain-containing protein [uncultured Roseovarius sp.]
MLLDASQTKRLVALHGWLATALSILLYAVILSGTVVVFADEIGHWSEKTTLTNQALSQPVNRHFQRIAAQVPADLKEDVIIGEGPNGTLRLFFGGARPRLDGGGVATFGREYIVQPDSGAIVSAKSGFLEDLSATRPSEALADFLVELHVRLHVPGRWGLYLTGILGIAMLIAAITGVLIHRNIIKELFVAERPGGRMVSYRDRHNLAGVWSLPFAVLLAFTGAFLSFAVSLGLPVVAMVAFGGDQTAALEAVVGAPMTKDASPAEVADIDLVLLHAQSISKTTASVLNIHNAGRADAIIETFHTPARGYLSGMSLEFNGATGAFLGPSFVVGTAPSVGSTLVDLAVPLHFGNFAGKASRIVWAALGAAMTFTVVSGLHLWFRRRETPLWSTTEWAFETVVWGLPLAMVGAAYGYFLARLAGDPIFWTAQAFLITSTGVIVGSFVIRYRPDLAQAKVFGPVLGSALCLLPIVRLQSGGLSWGEAVFGAETDIFSLDLFFLISGAIFLIRSRKTRLHAEASST